MTVKEKKKRSLKKKVTFTLFNESSITRRVLTQEFRGECGAGGFSGARRLAPETPLPRDS